MKEIKVLELMSYVGKCYKTDLMLYLKEDNYGYSSTVIKNLLSKQYLEQTDVLCKDDANRDTIEVLSITKKGRIHLSDALNDNDYHVEMEKFLHSRFSSSSIKELHRGLTMSRILLFMSQAGIRVFPNEKPSIFALQDMARGASPAPADFYDNSLSIDEVLETGAFYTKDELNEFYNFDELKGEGDTFSGTRIRGVYIDRHRSCVIFQPNVFKSQTLKLRGQDEARALANMRTHTPFCTVNKTSNFDAIVLTNGSGLIVDIGIGGKNGKVGSKIIGVGGNNKTGERFLSYATTYYDNIYCFAHNLTGIRGLRYFRTYQSVEERNTHVRESTINGNFSLIPEDFTRADSEIILADDNTDDNTRAIFLPYFNLKQLERIRKMPESISIITQKEMADMISHIIRKGNRIYDLEGNLVEVNRYQENGLKAGTSTPEQKRYYRQKHSLIHIEIPETLKDEIKRNAKLEGVTVSKYIRRLLVPAVKADTEAKTEIYETKQQLEKDTEKHSIKALK